jgi:hypothetical protein
MGIRGTDGGVWMEAEERWCVKWVRWSRIRAWPASMAARGGPGGGGDEIVVSSVCDLAFAADLIRA